MKQAEINEYNQRVQALIGQGKVTEAGMLSHWVIGRQNQQSLRRLQEGMATPEAGEPVFFSDINAPRPGIAYQIISLSLAPGSATYQAVLNMLHAEFVFTPDGTPEPGKGSKV